MIRPAIIFCITFVALARLQAQETTPLPSPSTTAFPTPTPITTSTLQKRGLLSRMLHPFSSSEVLPKYSDKRLLGLVLNLQLSPQPVRLSEIRQIEVRVTVTNQGKRVVTLDFPNDQRIEIYLINAADVILTRWSENHAINEKPGTVLINPGEHVEYKETIATRDLTPGKVFTAEAFFPKYPDLRVRQKFLAEP